MDGPTGTEKIVLTTATGAFFGAAMGSIESVWSIPKLGAQLPKLSAQMKHLGSRSLVFAAVGALYSTGEYVTSAVRQKDDFVNAAVGGLTVGVVPGIVKSNMRMAAATSIAASVGMGAATYWKSSQNSPFEKFVAARHSDRT